MVCSLYADDVFVLTSRPGWVENEAEVVKGFEDYMNADTTCIEIKWSLLQGTNVWGVAYYADSAQLVKDGEKIKKTDIDKLEQKMKPGTVVGTVAGEVEFDALLVTMGLARRGM